MRALVVYESMYGNTHLVAKAIAAGLGLPAGNVLPVVDVTEESLVGLDLLVVGGPTHVHGMSRESTRKAAVEAATKDPAKGLTVDAEATGPGLREWFDGLGTLEGAAAAFDTRLTGPAMMTGRASKSIAKHLRHHGLRLVLPPESFLVDRSTRLIADEEKRAHAWGERLARHLVTIRPTPAGR
jgi:hypothetical protein